MNDTPRRGFTSPEPDDPDATTIRRPARRAAADDDYYESIFADVGAASDPGPDDGGPNTKDDVFASPEESHPPAKADSSGSMVGIIMAALIIVGLIGAGLILHGTSHNGEQLPAPEPSATFSLDPDSALRVEGKPMSKLGPGDMEPNSVLIPDLTILAPVRDVSTFSTVKGQKSMDIPSDPADAAWWTKSAPLVGGAHGPTTVTGHVAWGDDWGAFHHLSQARAGMVVWTKNKDGRTQKWVVNKVYVRPRTEFPQELWSDKGARRLVLITCGGEPVHNHFPDNVFVEAIPVAT